MILVIKWKRYNPLAVLTPKLIGSGFNVQRLLPVEVAYYIDQDPEYPAYAFRCTGFIYITITEFL
jgi:hypothetical protein